MKRLLLFVLALFLPGAPAKAQLADCMSPGYIATFEVPGVTELTCAEVFRFSFDTPGGPREVRGIADLNADWSFQPGTIAASEAAARQATAALADLGNYRIGDVTILLLADQLEPEATVRRDAGPVLAQAWDPADSAVSECRMTQFLWGRGGVTADFPTTLAHELFHCVQYATLSPDQMATLTKGGDWWIEGSAEAFAAFAIPDSIGTAAWGADFNANVSARVPLYKMSYESVIFFYWLIGERGIGGLLPFLAGMSGEIGHGPQRAAMREAMTDDQWLDFAKAYADETIGHPHGQPLGLEGRFPIEHVQVEATSTHTLTFEAFAVIPGEAFYECGKWENVSRPDDANLASRMASAFDWQTGWLREIDTRDGGEPDMRFVAMNTGDADLSYQLRARRMAACSPCQGATELDRCMVGYWEGDTRVLIDLMRRAGAPISRNAMGPMYLALNEDGTWIASASPIDFQTVTPHPDGVTTVDVRGQTGGGGGRWAILGPGQLVGCTDWLGDLDAVADTQSPNVSASTPLFAAGTGGEEGTARYSCSAGTMSTTVRMGRFGDVVFPFTRLSPPPEDE